MRWHLSVVISLAVLSGCTATPDRYKQQSAAAVLPAEALPDDDPDGKQSAIANAQIGMPQQYIDSQSGMFVELTVNSEYFSANGRYCRRFVEVMSMQNRSGVSCQDERGGWVDLPLTDYLR